MLQANHSFWFLFPASSFLFQASRHRICLVLSPKLSPSAFLSTSNHPDTNWFPSDFIEQGHIYHTRTQIYIYTQSDMQNL
ncbi:hypothetical protein AQUCO_00700887v1 [Aquilegia coerulea]|uniref:Secreted protein n=1 Tax=Aquilegia coerulea TaxID=218851 RepID=A0A2G5EM86_AQUCA|nr:hypothetical protein AQUCO_00700887v1 [Aquilegia coerulea]